MLAAGAADGTVGAGVGAATAATGATAVWAVATDAARQPSSKRSRRGAKKYFRARGIRCRSLAKSRREENSY